MREPTQYKKASALPRYASGAATLGMGDVGRGIWNPSDPPVGTSQ
jgi:hypothetical protein